jgi:hypothetical protein
MIKHADTGKLRNQTSGVLISAFALLIFSMSLCLTVEV